MLLINDTFGLLENNYCRNICNEMLKMMKTNNGNTNGLNKVLNAPIHLGSMAANLESNVEDIKSIWVVSRDDSLVNYTYI